MLNIGFIKKNISLGIGGGGEWAYSLLVNYQSFRLLHRSIPPPTKYFSLLNEEFISKTS